MTEIRKKETINTAILTLGLLRPLLSLPLLIRQLFFIDFKNKSIHKTLTLEFIYSIFYVLFFVLYVINYHKNSAVPTFTQFFSLENIVFIIELLLLAIVLPFSKNIENFLYSISLGMLIKSLTAAFFSIFKFKTLKLYGSLCYEFLAQKSCNTNNISIEMIFFALVYFFQQKDEKRKLDEYLLLLSFVAAYFLGGRTFYLITIPLAFYFLDNKTLSKIGFLISFLLFFDIFFNDNYLVNRLFSISEGVAARTGLVESYAHSVSRGAEIVVDKSYGLYFHNTFIDIHYTTNLWLAVYFVFILFFPIITALSLPKKTDHNSLLYFLVVLIILSLNVPLEGLQYSIFIFIFILSICTLRATK